MADSKSKAKGGRGVGIGIGGRPGRGRPPGKATPPATKDIRMPFAAGAPGAGLRLGGSKPPSAGKRQNKTPVKKKAAPNEMDALRGLLAAASGSKPKLGSRASSDPRNAGPGSRPPPHQAAAAPGPAAQVTSPPPTKAEKDAFANLFQNFVAQAPAPEPGRGPLGTAGAAAPAQPLAHPAAQSVFTKGGHKLDRPWVLWYDEPASSNGRHSTASWEDQLNMVYRVTYVEEFWALLSQIATASEIEMRTNYHFFREGIKPMWEHPRNHAGGKWVCNLHKNNHGRLDELWEQVLMLCIGESCGGASDEICGAVLSPRSKHDRIAIWTSDASQEANVMVVGAKFNNIIQKANLTHKAGQKSFTYQSHDEDAASVVRYSLPA